MGGGVAAHADLLVVPVAHPVDVDLPQDVGFLRVDPVQLLIGRGAQVRLGRESVAHQLVAGEAQALAIHLQVELQTVGEHRVERHHGADAVLVLGVDDLLGLLVEG